MSIVGPDGLRALQDALRDVRREEDEVARRLARSTDIISKTQESEGELFRQLAARRLDAAAQAQLANDLLAADRLARDMLKRHAVELADVEAQLTAHDAAIADRNGLREAEAQAGAVLEAQLEALADRVAREGEVNPAYRAQRADVEKLRAVARAATVKTERAEAEREQKGRPYRDDALFMYLWEAGYGGRSYRANGLTSYFDGLVAGLVRYAEARPNFALLNDIPMRLREHADRQNAIAGKAEAGLRSGQIAAVDAAGGQTVRTTLAAARKRIAALDAEIVALEDARDDAARAQRDLAQGRDPAFAGAVSALADALLRDDLRLMLHEARVTRAAPDDAIVQQIDEARQRAFDEQRDTQAQKARLKTLTARRRDLEDIEYDFKALGFDSPRARFGDDRLTGVWLNDFLRGGIGVSDYWEQWRQHHDWSGRTVDADDDDSAGRGRFAALGGSGGFGAGEGRQAGGGTGNRGGFGRPRKGTGMPATGKAQQR